MPNTFSADALAALVSGDKGRVGRTKGRVRVLSQLVNIPAVNVVIGDLWIIGTIPSNAHVHKADWGISIPVGGAGTSAALGVFDRNTLATVDQDNILPAQGLNAAVNWTQAFPAAAAPVAADIQAIWERIPLTADPGLQYVAAWRVTAVAAANGLASIIGARVYYTVD